MLIILQGHALDKLAELPDESVQMCCTSPPYWGLRSYGTEPKIWGGEPSHKHEWNAESYYRRSTAQQDNGPGGGVWNATSRGLEPSSRRTEFVASTGTSCRCGAWRGELGNEPTPDLYVAHLVEVFREVRRVLRKDGTLWLNLGDSYNGSSGNGGDTLKQTTNAGSFHDGGIRLAPGLKPKDLVGIPWLVAKALQAPYYIGRIKAESDRAWLAGFLDGEGTISYIERDRGESHTPTHDVRVFFTNCDRKPLDHFAALTAGHVHQHDGKRENRFGSRPCYRWQMGTHDSALLLRELYPYLRTKRKQAALVWTLYTTLRHQNGHARTPVKVVEKRRALAEMIRALNAGGDLDLPEWIEEPESPYEPGWYLRQWMPWVKRNPMPESATDRPSSACEIVFLLSRSERYHYDAEAVKLPASMWHGGGKQNPGNGDKQFGEGRGNYGLRADKQRGHSRRHAGFNDCWDQIEKSEQCSGWRQTRNSDWFFEGLMTDGQGGPLAFVVSPAAFPEAHFATFPPNLVKPCVLAGCPAGGTILDPFLGSGTTAMVALELGRKAVGIELKPEYVQMARQRCQVTPGLPLA